MQYRLRHGHTALLLSLLLWGLSPTRSTAQTFTHRGELWLGYITSLPLTPRVAIWNDFHFMAQSFFVSRHGLTYTLSPQSRLSGGYAWLATATSFSQRLIRHEHRLWWQIDNRFPLTDRLSLRLRFRHDIRYRQALQGEEVLDSWIMYHRLRLMPGIRYTLRKLPNQRSVHLNVLDEVLVNLGGQVRNGLDQNRLYLLLGHSRPGLTILGGYDNRLIPRGSGQYSMRHGLTVWVIHTLRTLPAPEDTGPR